MKQMQLKELLLNVRKNINICEKDIINSKYERTNITRERYLSYVKLLFYILFFNSCCESYTVKC